MIPAGPRSFFPPSHPFSTFPTPKKGDRNLRTRFDIWSHGQSPERTCLCLCLVLVLVSAKTRVNCTLAGHEDGFRGRAVTGHRLFTFLPLGTGANPFPTTNNNDNIGPPRGWPRGYRKTDPFILSQKIVMVEKSRTSLPLLALKGPFNLPGGNLNRE